MKNKIAISVLIVVVGALVLWGAHAIDVIGFVKHMHGR
jgi:hypothetical protein